MTAKCSHENKKIFLEVLEGRKVDRTPFWLMRQAGRYLPEYRAIRAGVDDFLQLCFTPKLAAEVTMQPINRFQMDAAIIFADILLVPKALGQKVSFQAGEGPILHPVRNKSEIPRASVDNLNMILEPIYETVSAVKSQLPKTVTLIGFAGSPWTVACYMVEGHGSREFNAPRLWALSDPETFAQLIEVLVEATSRYLVEQIRAGAEVVQLFDTWCGVLSETEFERWVIEPTRKIVDLIRGEFEDFPIIGFPKGAGANYKTFIQKTGVTGISLDHGMPLEYIQKHLQPLAAIQGNLDPRALVAGGRALDQGIGRISRGLGQGGFIFNLGHGITPDTPVENVEKLAKFFHDQR